MLTLTVTSSVHSSGWGALQSSDNQGGGAGTPPIPTPTAVGSQPFYVAPDRRIHILDGDNTGGGHRPGLSISGKSEFPVGWSDDRIIQEIENVANDPASIRTLQPNGRTSVEGTRDGLLIRVIVNLNKAIQTAHPLNVPRNP